MKRIIIFCFLFFCKYSFGDSNFVIQKIHTDNIYYNVIIHENNAYVSSNNGIFFIDTLSELDEVVVVGYGTQARKDVFLTNLEKDYNLANPHTS